MKSEDEGMSEGKQAEEAGGGRMQVRSDIAQA